MNHHFVTSFSEVVEGDFLLPHATDCDGGTFETNKHGHSLNSCPYDHSWMQTTTRKEGSA
jgi:hypothetical protein